jgi:RNA polymerase sigma factor (sigma-70 family)
MLHGAETSLGLIAKPLLADGSARAESPLADLYRRHLGELTRYIIHTFGAGPPDPEDVVQEAFAQFAALEDPQAVENPRAFLYRSAHNLVVDHHRRHIVRNRFAREQAPAPDAEISDDRDAERVSCARQRLSIVEQAIRSMEPRRRTVFVLHRIHELSYAEISRRLRMPETTVKRLVAAAIVDCERSLRSHGMSGEEPGR